MKTIRALLAGAAGAVAVIAGCDTAPRVSDPAPRAPVPQAPSYEEVARRYNERAQHFDRLWARATLRMRYRDEAGNWQTEQGDGGHLMLVQPDHLALSTGKLGEPFFRLGSNAEQYWWFDLRKPRRAWVGRHDTAAARGADAAESPIPIPPRDLIELLGVTPLPTDAPGRVEWSADRRALVVTVPTDAGSRRLTLDPQTYEPATIELLDETGALVVGSELSEYTPVTVFGVAARPRLPRYVVVSDPADEGELRLTISAAENSPGKSEPSDTVFDFEALVRAHNVAPENITDLDAGGGASPRLSERAGDVP